MNLNRVTLLNDAPTSGDGRYVLYWMQQSQRVAFNPALEYAIGCANEHGLPVVVGFGLFDRYPEANERHFAFMLEGLVDVETDLRARGIQFAVRLASPDAACLELAQHATLVVCDRGYLRHQKTWRDNVARDARRQVVQVEGDVVVPVDEASDKREYAARTIRPKLNRLVESHLAQVKPRQPEKSSLRLRIGSDVDLGNLDKLLSSLNLDRSVARVARFKGGSAEARRRLGAFLRNGLKGYGTARNDPAQPQCSNLSPYLHFGQISPVEIVRKSRAAKSSAEQDHAVFLEELIVRRELAMNFVHFESDYDRYTSLPDWAKRTLAKHRGDTREHLYTPNQLENAATHDPYWNAAMTEMLRTGYMHNYMRMYWGKKIIEWSNTPEDAYETTLFLNNKYFIDGRDANSYVGVGWVFGLHDRPWTERNVFGMVRYMNAAGLERKFKIKEYVLQAEQLVD